MVPDLGRPFRGSTYLTLPIVRRYFDGETTALAQVDSFVVRTADTNGSTKSLKTFQPTGLFRQPVRPCIDRSVCWLISRKLTRQSQSGNSGTKRWSGLGPPTIGKSLSWVASVGLATTRLGKGMQI